MSVRALGFKGPSESDSIDANTHVYVNFVYDVYSGKAVTTDKTVSTFRTDFRYSF